MNTKYEHEKLMNEWKRNRSHYQNFVTDGILNYEVYYSSKPKIAVLLKESNDDFIDIAPITHKGYGPDGNSHLFWRHINIFIHVATAAWDNQQMSYTTIHEITEKPINSIAYINVKKNAENKPKSDNNDILSYAKQDAYFLQKQIEIIRPEVIFCCNTKNCYDFIEETQHINHNVFMTNDKLIIDYYHPSYPIGFEKCVQDLSICLFDNKVQKAITAIKNRGKSYHPASI